MGKGESAGDEGGVEWCGGRGEVEKAVASLYCERRAGQFEWQVVVGITVRVNRRNASDSPRYVLTKASSIFLPVS